MKACIQSAIGETTPKVGCFTFANGLTTGNKEIQRKTYLYVKKD